MKHVLACLIAWKDRESSFHHCVGPVKARGSLFVCGKGLTKPF